MTDTRWEPGPGARYVTAGGEIVNRLGIPDPEPASVPVLGPPPLSFHSLGELLDAQAMAPPPTYLAEGIWPGDAYGVLGRGSDSSRSSAQARSCCFSVKAAPER